MEEQDLIKQNAKEDYLNGVKNREIASKYEISENTLKSWIRRGKWKTEKEALKEGAHKEEKGAPHKSKGAPLKEQEKPKNAQSGGGNPEPQNQFPKRNQAARKHGLNSKYFTDTQREILDDFKDFTFADQIWLQIELKFSAIIQLQKVMWVETADDHLQIESGSSSGEGGSSVSYKVAFAYERYGAYIKAQARAMAEYRNLTKRFLELSGEDDERRLRLQGMELDVEKRRLEVAKLQKEVEPEMTNESNSYEELTTEELRALARSEK